MSSPADVAPTSIDVRTRSTSVVVHVAGEFDIGTLPILKQALARARQANADVLLDLSEVTFADASSLGVLMDARSALAERGHTIHIVNPAHVVTRLLSITGLTQVLMPAP
jgi:anti-sigma B factor antagonist